MSDCLFCKIAAGEIPCDKVYEDDKVIAFKDINPKAKVHLLVVPREHIASLNELTPEHDALIAHMTRVIPQLAKSQGLDDGFRTIINTGKGGGQIIFHLHMHLMGGKDLPGFE
ncbi:MAG: histidine triad nucleotide-binding protein [Halobacteria archaeon]|nr:histidine triad nucleotide-binding protein [Halobacteria archaeon]